MNEYSNSLERWAKASINKTLMSVIARAHIQGSTIERLPYHAIRLQFQGNSPGFFDCAPDGSSLVFRDESLQPISMGEAGELVLQDVSTDQHLGPVVGSRLSKVSLVHSEREGTDIGLRLEFDNRAEVIIANLGDELMVCDAIGEELVRSESLVYRPMTL